MTTVLVFATAMAMFAVAYFIGRSIGRQQGVDSAADAASDIAHEYIDRVLAKSSSAEHHSELHLEIDMLRMALAEANRRLADTGVTISVEETVAFTDIANGESQ